MRGTSAAAVLGGWHDEVEEIYQVGGNARPIVAQECTICVEQITANTGVLTHCGHRFHQKRFEIRNVERNQNTQTVSTRN
eukprot:8447796-Pyramimonas_sp.AAC.1